MLSLTLSSVRPRPTAATRAQPLSHASALYSSHTLSHSLPLLTHFSAVLDCCVLALHTPVLSIGAVLASVQYCTVLWPVYCTVASVLTHSTVAAGQRSKSALAGQWATLASLATLASGQYWAYVPILTT